MTDKRDEQLIALESSLQNAERKLKQAENTVNDLQNRLKSNEESFLSKLESKSEKYKNQTGAELERYVDKVTGKANYSFTREATDEKIKKRKKLVLKRYFDTESGKSSLKADVVVDESDRKVSINSAEDLKKPKERQRFVAYKFNGIKRLDLTLQSDNAFVKAVGTPLIVPVRSAQVIAQKLAESNVGKAAATTAKVAVLPYKTVKDIADKGGIIHSVVDLGDRVRIEGVNMPKPVQLTANAAISVALGAETVAVETSKKAKKFTLEIAKNKILEELNNDISDNEASRAAYVIGMKTIDVYKILDEHSKFKRAVIRDKAGDDIVDVNVSRYLAFKEEKQYQDNQDLLKQEQKISEDKLKNARAEYDKAKRRLDDYKKSVQTVDESLPIADPKSDKDSSPDIGKEKKSISEDNVVQKSKTERKIEKTKQKIKDNKKYEYKVRLKKSAVPDKNGNAATKIAPAIVKEEVVLPKQATAWNTAKKLDSYAVNTGVHSLRRKAMRDGSDNVGVEAADFAITSVQKANQAVKFLDEKERAYKDKALRKKLNKLENKKELDLYAQKLRESSDTTINKSKNGGKEKKVGDKAKKQRQKKRQQKLVRKNMTEQARNTVRKKAEELISGLIKKRSSLVVLLALAVVVPVIIPIMLMSGSGIIGGVEDYVGKIVCPCETNDLSLMDRYFTELAADLIETHQNIESYYQGYSKYVCLTDIDKINHSIKKLLPYVAVSVMESSDDGSVDYESSKPFIEAIFDELYELYTNEKHEIRKHVTEKTESSTSDYYSLGSSIYTLGDTDYYSEHYAGYANTYTYVEVPVANGWNDVTIDCIGKYTDKNGYTHEYDDAQTITFSNYWELKLIFEWDGSEYYERWQYSYDWQEYYEYDYYILEYAIRENSIDVDDSYWTDTDSDWQDNNFDKLIYNLYLDMSDEAKEQFDVYYSFFMGHQIFDMPFENPTVSKYAGYNTDIYGDRSLELSFELETYEGQEIICGMDGEITLLDNGFSVYNSKYGTIYYDGAIQPEAENGKQGEVISSSTGNVLRITFIDDEGNYINPLLIFA